jgi:hypothetical protein
MIAEAAPSKRDYFVDEAGDAVLFCRTGHICIGQEGCSRHFILGMADIPQVQMSSERTIRLHGAAAVQKPAAQGRPIQRLP